MKKELVPKIEQRSLKARLEAGEFDQEVTKLITHLGLTETSMPFSGFEGLEKVAHAKTPEELRLGAADILKQAKLSESVKLAQAQALSLEAEFNKQLPNNDAYQRFTKAFERFYHQPSEEHHRIFQEQALILENLLKEKEAAQEDNVDLIPAVQNLSAIEEELFAVAQKQKESDLALMGEKAAESVKLNAEIQGVEKARDVMVDAMSQQAGA